MYLCIRLLQLTLSDQSLKLKGILKAAASSSTLYPNISFIQMAHHRGYSLTGEAELILMDLVTKHFT